MKNERKSESMKDDCMANADRSPVVPVLSSRDLLKGMTEVRIDHDGELYRLRQTRQGKLILTK